MTSTTKLEQLLDELVRPALRAHGGDAELVSYEEGILRLRMLGQCAGCPAASKSAVMPMIMPFFRNRFISSLSSICLLPASPRPPRGEVLRSL